MDLYADVEGEVVLLPGEIKLISAGIYLSIPEGYEAEIRPRSGLALKHGVSLVNTPGTIAKTNWSLTIPMPLEELLKHKIIKDIKALVDASGRSVK